MAYLGLVEEFENDWIDRPVWTYAQVPPHGKTFSESLSVPSLRNIPLIADSKIDNQLVVDAISAVREHNREYRREHLGLLILEGDMIRVTTGTTRGSFAELRRGPEGTHVVSFGGVYAGG
jgi:hypothetical protein